MGLDPDTCEDLVQDAFVSAYLKLRECKDPPRFGLWVHRILRNRCLDHLKDIRRKTVPIEDVTLHSRQGRPDRDAEQARMRTGIRDGLDALTPPLREAFLMKHHLGMEYAEMAELEGVTVSAMKMRVQRAREALRRTLEALDLAQGM
jgi:RNA polymerase sigma-70 factor (ECF subfamily)